MILYTYFDGATGPVGPAGETNYSEDYVAAELQTQRESPVDDDGVNPASFITYGSFKPGKSILVQALDKDLREGRTANWQRLCDEMRKAVEGKL